MITVYGNMNIANGRKKPTMFNFIYMTKCIMGHAHGCTWLQDEIKCLPVMRANCKGSCWRKKYGKQPYGLNLNGKQ